MTISDEEITRFWGRVEKTESCWLWRGGIINSGYGRFYIKRKIWVAHRVSYILTRGPVPIGLCLDHLCRNRACVNPDHLDLVTQRENTLRGMHPNQVIRRTGMCHKGHSSVDAWVSAGGKKECRKCKSERRRKYYLAFECKGSLKGKVVDTEQFLTVIQQEGSR